MDVLDAQSDRAWTLSLERVSVLASLSPVFVRYKNTEYHGYGQISSYPRSRLLPLSLVRLNNHTLF